MLCGLNRVALGGRVMRLQNWKTQLRKGLLELCILNFLRARECYGYDLVQELKQVQGLHMREGTIYPILARLEEDGLVDSRVRSSDNGPPRKYFRLTRTGKQAVEEMNEHWAEVEAAVAIARNIDIGGHK